MTSMPEKDVPLVEFMHLVFTCMPGDSEGNSGLYCCTCMTSFGH